MGNTSENTIDKVLRGPRGPKLKLQPADVFTIRGALANGVSEAALALKYSVTKISIINVKKGRTWAHLGPRHEPQ